MRASEVRAAAPLEEAADPDEAALATSTGADHASSRPSPGGPHTAAGARGHDLVLGRYQLLRRLGAGAFGVVWHAYDARLEREVALKSVPRERVVVGRLRREARAAARLSHPGIVTLYEAALDGDGAHLVSELVRGETLQALLLARRLSDRDVIGIVASLCDALDHAHSQGVIHRDVKPSNILVPDQPSSFAHPAKLTDFGVAHVIGGDSLTHTGDVLGTAAYMAPEQAEGLEVGPAADLYALALVAYEALTGVNPVRTGAAAARSRRLGAYLPPLRRQRRDLPRELGRAIDLALRPRPRERGSLADLRETLVAIAADLDDTPGLVVPHGLPPAHPLAAEVEDPLAGPSGELYPPSPEPSPWRAAPGPAPAAEDGPDLAPLPPRWPVRALTAAATAASIAWVVARVLAPSPVAPVGAGVAAAILVLALPRPGWVLAWAAVGGAAAVQGRGGAAVLLLPAVLLPVILLPRREILWPLAAAAPALAFLGLGGAWPALAGTRRFGPWRRGALGLIGWVWLAVGAALAGRQLYLRTPPGVADPAAWRGSASAAVHEALVPLIHSGILLAAPVWAAACVLLPWLTRRRTLGATAVVVAGWAAGTVAACAACLAAAHVPGQPLRLLPALLGAVGAAVLALGAAALDARRSGVNAADVLPQLP